MDLALRVNEAKVPTWFSAKTYLEPIGAAHGIERFDLVVTVGLCGDTASYPCFLTINATTYRNLSAGHCDWEHVIAYTIQATVFGFRHFAEFLRQRAFQLRADLPGKSQPPRVRLFVSPDIAPSQLQSFRHFKQSEPLFPQLVGTTTAAQPACP